MQSVAMLIPMIQAMHFYNYKVRLHCNHILAAYKVSLNVRMATICANLIFISNCAIFMASLILITTCTLFLNTLKICSFNFNYVYPVGLDTRKT